MIMAMGRGTATRRLRRWARTTPNGQIGMTLLGVGAALVLIALIFLGVDAHWV